MKTWMVRAGIGGVFADVFRARSIVGLGWRSIADLSKYQSREELQSAMRIAYPDYPNQAVAMNTGQLFRFAKEIQLGDRIVSYDPSARLYLCGSVSGEYRYCQTEEDEELANQRSVVWHHDTPRDQLSDAAKNSLGSIATLFLISPEVTAELWGKSPKIQTVDIEAALDGQPLESAPESAAALNGRSKELIKDRIAALDWAEMQDLVAGLLRGMGYKTTVSPKGADRGKDIMASPDRFGFEEPRIVVEVKHRRNERMGSNEIRSFLGGRHAKDKGLYVSTGGFTQEARYEAERAGIPLTLMDLELLVDAILEHYGSFDQETKRLLPLQQVYWPA
jgi:restriction system protein